VRERGREEGEWSGGEEEEERRGQGRKERKEASLALKGWTPLGI